MSAGHVRGAHRGPQLVGRYVLHDPISAGGMASVHYGRLRGAVGFSRTVAIKRMLPGLAEDQSFASMFLDEARLAARIHHPNVVATLDVVEQDGELFLVMEYVAGVSLSTLLKEARAARRALPAEHAAAIAIGVLHGLHAAHEATNAAGEPLEIIHRDVSPQNILVGADGLPRLIDFGIAKAAERIYATRDNELRGKIAYMAPEQLQGLAIDRRADVYSTAVVLWELLTGRTYVEPRPNATPASTILEALHRLPEGPSTLNPKSPRELDEIVLRALSHDPARRPATALEMAAAIEREVVPSTQLELGEWVNEVAGSILERRAALLRFIESEPTDFPSGELTPALGSGPHAGRTGPPPPLASLAPGPQTGSVWTQPHDRPPSRLDLRPLAAVAVVLAVVFAWYLGTKQRAPAIDAAAPPAQAAPPFPEPAPPPPESAPVELDPPAVATPPVELDPPPAAAASSPPPVTTARRSPPKGVNCNPPYVVERGIRRVKKECN